jgi:hypothetical protein
LLRLLPDKLLARLIVADLRSAVVLVLAVVVRVKVVGAEIAADADLAPVAAQNVNHANSSRRF